jgi:hypothetical protein
MGLYALLGGVPDRAHLPTVLSPHYSLVAKRRILNAIPLPSADTAALEFTLRSAAKCTAWMLSLPRRLDATSYDIRSFPQPVIAQLLVVHSQHLIVKIEPLSWLGSLR